MIQQDDNSLRTLEEEKRHHDKWASETDVRAINFESFFEGSTSPENRFIMSILGDIRGKRILDLGCGIGENSVYFAKNGAECIAADYSPGMIEKVKELARYHNVSIEGMVMNAEDIDLPDNTFDIVYAANLLHHVNPEKTLLEMHRVLKTGGKVCFWDPLKHNIIINIYRRMAKEVRTQNERPLNIRIINFIRSLFSDVQFDTFWLCTLWIFLRFYFVEHVNPNKERYWKKIIYEEDRLKGLYYKLEKYDAYLKKIKFLKRFAWNIAVVATK